MFDQNNSLEKNVSINNVNYHLATHRVIKKIKFNPDNLNDVRDFFSAPLEKRKTILCSVRNQKGEESDIMNNYLLEQEQKGNFCYYPPSHNFQKDEYKGLVICNTMRFAIQNSGVVSVFYNPASEGTKFDVGITLYVKASNPSLKLELIPYKGAKEDELFQFLEDVTRDEKFLKEFISEHQDVFGQDKIEYTHEFDEFGKLTPLTALKFGMVFGSQKPFKITNIEETIRASNNEKTSEGLPISKSYTKVALLLHDLYNPQTL